MLVHSNLLHIVTKLEDVCAFKNLFKQDTKSLAKIILLDSYKRRPPLKRCIQQILLSFTYEQLLLLQNEASVVWVLSKTGRSTFVE